jgi:hypothetical protein
MSATCNTQMRALHVVEQPLVQMTGHKTSESVTRSGLPMLHTKMSL